MLYRKPLSVLLFISTLYAFAQQPATPASSIKSALVKKQTMAETSLVKNLAFESIGPSIMSGRVVDLDVNPEQPSEFYVAYASGGVWHTRNNGTSFTPIMDNAGTQNVGDIAVHWPTRTLYVGTGENNASRSSYAGIGILKTTDNGKTWDHLGLTDTHRIGRIVIHPENPDIVVLGATGHLYSASTERGIYKTTDGGQTWQQTLFVDDRSGIIDLQHSPDNYNVMFASSWTKDRKAWNFTGHGKGSAIYKSTDAGQTWTEISTKASGFPTGDGVGRIGMAVFSDTLIYAIHDNQHRRPDTSRKSVVDALSKADFKTMSTAACLALDNDQLNGFLSANRFPERYTAETVKQMLRSGAITPDAMALYLEDANTLLFDTPVIGAEVYKSTDGGQSWSKTHDDYLDGIYFSYGYYFGHIHVSPANANHVYIYGVPILKSKDGGKTFTSISAENVHSDHHALWINPKNPNHLVNGNDGGVNVSYDDGANWIKNNAPSVGQFYAITIDHEKPYNVYGGLQDNGVWKGAHNAREDKAWQENGQYPWKKIMGSDGMQVQIDSRNSDVVYTGFQFGNYYRLNLETGERESIQPKHSLGEAPYRFNWQTPILLSSHNPDILYFGANKLMRSMNQGTNWEPISPDLTKGGKKGNVPYGTLTAISESPMQFGLLYTGSDDGLVYRTKDDGASWTAISKSLPKELWVSRVVASQHKKERVYVTLNGYRWDDFKVYVYRSDDYGQTWTDLGTRIPMAPVNVIREDPSNANILYLGTDNAAYVSFDKGASWELFSKGLPDVAIHDIVVQPDAKHLLLGTHGRSIYKANIAALQHMHSEMKTEAITLFETEAIRHSRYWGRSRNQWSEAYEPETTIAFYSNAARQITINVLSQDGSVLHTMSVDADEGFNYAPFDLSLSEAGRTALMTADAKLQIPKAGNGTYYMPKGRYAITIDGVSTELEIK